MRDLSRRQHLRARLSFNRIGQDLRKQHAGIHRLRGRVRDTTLARSNVSQRFPVVPMAHRNRSEPHQRSVARSIRAGGTCDWVTSPFPPGNRLPHSDADVEAAASARVLAVSPPAQEPRRKIGLVEARFGDEAVRERERHRGIVSPLSRLQSERIATDHVGQHRIGIASIDVDGAGSARAPSRRTYSFWASVSSAPGLARRTSAIARGGYRLLFTHSFPRRPSYLFFGSDTGGERAAIIYSIIETCKLNRIEELLPWNLAKELNQPAQVTQALAA